MRYKSLVLFELLSKTRLLTTAQIKLFLFPCQNPNHFLNCVCFERSDTGVKDFLRELEHQSAICFQGPLPGIGRVWHMSEESAYQQLLWTPGITKRSVHGAVKKYLSFVEKTIRSPEVNHTLFVNDIYVWFVLSEKIMESKYDLYRGIPNWALHSDVSMMAEKGLWPDAVLGIKRYGRETNYYIEADRGTETRNTLAKKLIKYRECGRFHYEYEDKILFIFNSKQRLNSVFQSDKGNAFMATLKELRLEDDVFGTYKDRNSMANPLVNDVWITPSTPQEGTKFPHPASIPHLLRPKSFR